MPIEYHDAGAGFVDLHRRFDDVLSCTIVDMENDRTKYRCKYKGFWDSVGHFDLKIEKIKKEKTPRDTQKDGKTNINIITSGEGILAYLPKTPYKGKKEFHVTLNELPENKATSVTNMVETLATMVKHQFLEEIDNADIRWFDKFQDEKPTEVTMLWDDVRYSQPRWFA